jgi:hypothetical protein
MKIASIGIDIGKTTFHLVALDEHGSIVIRRKFSRKALLAYSAKLTTSLIGMEACGGAHCLARLLRDQGHQVRLWRLPRDFFLSQSYGESCHTVPALLVPHPAVVPYKLPLESSAKLPPAVKIVLIRNSRSW